MEAWHWGLLLVVNTPVYLLWGWIFFRSFEHFVECLRFWFTP